MQNNAAHGHRHTAFGRQADDKNNTALPFHDHPPVLSPRRCFRYAACARRAARPRGARARGRRCRALPRPARPPRPGRRHHRPPGPVHAPADRGLRRQLPRGNARHRRRRGRAARRHRDDQLPHRDAVRLCRHEELGRTQGQGRYRRRLVGRRRLHRPRRAARALGHRPPDARP